MLRCLLSNKYIAYSHTPLFVGPCRAVLSLLRPSACTCAGRIPTEIFDLPSLRELHLDKNKLTGALLLRVCDLHAAVDPSACSRCCTTSACLLLCTTGLRFCLLGVVAVISMYCKPTSHRARCLLLHFTDASFAQSMPLKLIVFLCLYLCRTHPNHNWPPHLASRS